ncbi:MAG: hypothetical protein ACYC3L_00115 [Gemmatimonadaceae bacterium]
MGPDVLVPISFFVTVVAIVLGVPLVRAHIKRADRSASLPAPDPRAEERLARIESAVEAIAIEVERISEGQRFVTKLLAERPAVTGLPRGDEVKS